MSRKKADVALYLMGSIAYAFSQWLVISIIAKCFSLQLAGEYVYVFAIFSPVAILFNFGLRNCLASDIGREYPDAAYKNIRAFGILLFSAVCVAYFSWGNESRWIIALVFFIKATDSLSELIYGAWLREKTSRNYGVSQILRLTSFGVLFLIGSIFSFDFVVLLFCYPVGVLVVWCFYDRRKSPLTGSRNSSRKIEFCLLRDAGKLGISSFLVAMGVSIPRLIVDASLGKIALAEFALLLYFVSIAAMFVMALSQVSTSDIARAFLHQKKNLRKIVRVNLLYPVIGYSLVFIAALVVAGPWFMKQFYGAENYEIGEFVLVGVGGSITFLFMALNTVLVAAREFKRILRLTTISVAVVAPIYVACIRLLGMEGRYIAYVSCASASLLIMVVQIQAVCRQRRHNTNGPL